jgi:hypothetical protein
LLPVLNVLPSGYHNYGIPGDPVILPVSQHMRQRMHSPTANVKVRLKLILLVETLRVTGSKGGKKKGGKGKMMPNEEPPM